MAKELASRLLNVDAYLRLSVERGVGKTGIGEWASLGEIETHTAGYIETQTVMSALEASLKRLKYRAGTVTLAQISESIEYGCSKPTHRRLCRSVKQHQGYGQEGATRIALLCEAREGMGETGVVPRHHALFTAENYAHYWNGRLRKDAIGVFFYFAGIRIPVGIARHFFDIANIRRFRQAVFVDASSPANIEADLQAWAGELGDGHEHDVWEDAIRILGMVPESERWALVLDNADDPTLNLGPLYPNICNNLTVIITSRNRNLGNLSTSHHVELREMEPEEAVTTLLSSALREAGLLPEELESANTLLKGIVEALHTGSQSFEMNSGGFRVSRSSRYDRQWEFW